MYLIFDCDIGYVYIYYCLCWGGGYLMVGDCVELCQGS